MSMKFDSRGENEIQKAQFQVINQQQELARYEGHVAMLKVALRRARRELERLESGRRIKDGELDEDPNITLDK